MLATYMTDRRDPESLYKEGIESVRSMLTESNFERLRTQAIGGASVSLGVILLLLQTDAKSKSLDVALYTSIFAVPVWVAVWQYIEAYVFCGKNSYAHFMTMKGSLVAGLLSAIGMILLLLSIVALIWHMSVIASVTFLVLSLVLAYFINRHQTKVRLFAQGGGSDDGA
ncbi:hypothetical protein L3067_14025 [Xanthomonas sp. PPL568]|uniref:hypothetical protein n=1 Tax=Xanthomonas indica TaxID=2912242 RepID=UPI001F5A8FD6|nr:hypothetical protein [Xanthomonas indica]MCI2245722.1 hypothetical protein [Xanthomonas indica]